MKKSPLLILVITLMLCASSGCCLFTKGDEDLLKEIRSGLVESVRPALVDALDKAKDAEGNPIYIDPYRNEKVNLVDGMVKAIDRVYPNTDDSGQAAPYNPKQPPWATGGD